MSSNIKILKICEYCDKEFIAKTTTTRFCSHACNSKDYKKRIKAKKVGKAIRKTNIQKILLSEEINHEIVKQKAFLSIKEAHKLIGLSESTFYRLMKKGVISYSKVGKRTIIKRSEIDKLLT